MSIPHFEQKKWSCVAVDACCATVISPGTPQYLSCNTLTNWTNFDICVMHARGGGVYLLGGGGVVAADVVEVVGFMYEAISPSEMNICIYCERNKNTKEYKKRDIVTHLPFYQTIN